MPLSTLDPLYLDDFVVGDRAGDPLITDGDDDDDEESTVPPIVDEDRVRMITPEWFSPGGQSGGRNVSVTETGFLPQYGLDKDGGIICGRTFFKVCSYNGTEVFTDGGDGSSDENPLFKEYSGSSQVNYKVDPDTGEISLGTDGSDAEVHIHTEDNGFDETLGLSQPIAFDGPTDAQSSSSDEGASCALSNQLSTQNQIDAVTSSLQILKTALDAGDDDDVWEGSGGQAGQAINQAVSGEIYGALVGGSVVRITSGEDTPPHNAPTPALRYRMESFGMQAALGYVGSGSVTLALSGSTAEKMRDEFGTYDPANYSVQALPWRGGDFRGTLDKFRVKFTSTDGSLWRIQIQEIHLGNLRGGITQVVMVAGAQFIETPPLSFSQKCFEIPDEWGSGSEAQQGPISLVVVKAEKQLANGSYENVPSISSAVSFDGTTPVLCLLQVREGVAWGMPALDGTTDKVYTSAVLTAQTTLEADEEIECECSEAAAGGTQYTAQRTIDPDNGLELLIPASYRANDPQVETLANTGTYGGREYQPFVTGEWPLTGLNAAAKPDQQNGTINGSGSNCDFGDNTKPAPDPASTVEFQVPSSDLQHAADTPDAWQTKYQMIIPDAGTPGLAKIVSVLWSEPG